VAEDAASPPTKKSRFTGRVVAERGATQADAEEEAVEAALPSTKVGRATARVGAKHEASPVEADGEAIFTASDMPWFSVGDTSGDVEQQKVQKNQVGRTPKQWSQSNSWPTPVRTARRMKRSSRRLRRWTP
jgi:hypothetical protein